MIRYGFGGENEGPVSTERERESRRKNEYVNEGV